MNSKFLAKIVEDTEIFDELEEQSTEDETGPRKSLHSHSHDSSGDTFHLAMSTRVSSVSLIYRSITYTFRFSQEGPTRWPHWFDEQ